MIFSGLLGEEIVAISTLRIAVPGDVIEPPDTAVLHLASGGLRQILIDDDRKVERSLQSPEELEIWGDYEDRLAVHLEVVQNLPLPLVPSEIKVVISTWSQSHWQDAGGETGTEYIVGALVYDEDGSEALGIRCDNDELIIETAKSFRAYLKRGRKGEILRWRHFGNAPF